MPHNTFRLIESHSTINTPMSQNCHYLKLSVQIQYYRIIHFHIPQLMQLIIYIVYRSKYQTKCYRIDSLNIATTQILNHNNSQIQHKISDDVNFLAIDGSAKKISIYYLKNRKLIKNMQLNGNISVIKFSENSKILFCGSANGQLHVYDIMNNFVLIYKNIVGQGEIQEIISIDSENILTHQDLFKTIYLNSFKYIIVKGIKSLQVFKVKMSIHIFQFDFPLKMLMQLQRMENKGIINKITQCLFVIQYQA
ncbi:U3 snoRNP protein [Paramecium bursaria]